MIMVKTVLIENTESKKVHMCCNMKRVPMIGMAMMGMGMAMIAGMMIGSCMNDRINSNKKSMRKFGMMKKSDESDLQKA